MSKFSLLDCTLRDGGYITDGKFNDSAIRDIIGTLILSHIDYIEVGYLNNLKPYNGNTTHWNSLEMIGDFIPKDRRGCTILAMVDVDQFGLDDFIPFESRNVEGIRIVFYKHQIERAIKYAERIKNYGYKLFVQPMVTIDYSKSEYSALCEKLLNLEPQCVSIVDSFGYMTPQDFRKYFKILDNIFPSDTIIGFHSHQNMELSLPTAIDVLSYNTERKLIIDCSLLGMGRGAGNLQTELIANYYNNNFTYKYDISEIIRLVNDYIAPIRDISSWGYSPYFFLTALNKCHPNYWCYLYEIDTNFSISEFNNFLKIIPDDMRTKCRRTYVKEIYNMYKESNK